ncbi:MAG: hypothetical protein ACREON_00750 [Gemmatimonadaceae bacterium]
MRSRLLALCALFIALFASAPRSADAQAVLGIGDDAMVLPRGALRVRVIFLSTTFDDRFGKNTPGRSDGDVEPLAIDFNREAIGVDQFQNLLPLQLGLRQLTGLSDYEVNLGRTVLDLNATVRSLPITTELGVTERFSIGLLVPYVWTRNEANFLVNPVPTQANVGFNPALGSTTAATTNQMLVTQFTAAAAALQARITACQANPAAEPNCPQIVAAGPGLVANSTAFAGGFQQVYLGSPLVPLTNSAADVAVRARIAALRGGYQSFGITTITAAAPFSSSSLQLPAPLNLSDAQRILMSQAFGIQANPLETTTHEGVGDIELGGKFQFLNTFGTQSRFDPPDAPMFRSAITTVVRFGTGDNESADDFIDIGRGNGQTDIELRSQTDMVWGRHFWGSLIARYNVQLADHEVMRITTPDRPLAPVYRRHRVKRDLGDILEVEATPRFVFNKWFSFAGSYLFRRKAEDDYSGTFQRQNLLGQLETLDAATLNDETEQTEHRLTAGLAISSLAAFSEGRFGFPFELWLQRSQSVAGSGGRTPRIFQNMVSLRVYTRLFGADSPREGQSSGS